MADPDLRTHLAAALAAAPDGPLRVGFSGGLDSSALLHALAALPEARARGLAAIHVDHGLHADSAAWAEHCVALCAALQLPLTILRVHVTRDCGDGLEAAARTARYTAFAGALPAGGVLALAHHRDDQAETVLLKLLRGAGPEGLGGMRPLRAFAGGWLWRPLLDRPRRALAGYVAAHGLACIDDPANAEPGLARSFLRHTILPQLARHWPDPAQALAASAALCRDAAAHLEAEATAALAALQSDTAAGLDMADFDATSLDARGWCALPAALRGRVLERWLHALDLPAPTRTQRATLEHQLATARSDRVPRVAWPGAEVRAWRGRLYALPIALDPPDGWKLDWNGAPLALPGGGKIELQPRSLVLDPPLRVRQRRAGEHLQPASDPHTRTLHDLFQRWGVPPWRRGRCPLIEDADGHLLAVADLTCTDAGAALFARLGARPRWLPGGRADPPAIASTGPLR